MKIKQSGPEKWLKFQCPGCKMAHVISNSWQFNGNFDRPTISPSIKVTGTIPITNDEHDRIMRGEHVEPVPLVCHSFIKDGRIEFLSDCTHELRGQTVDLPSIE